MEKSHSSEYDSAVDKADLACLMCRKRKLKWYIKFTFSGQYQSNVLLVIVNILFANIATIRRKTVLTLISDSNLALSSVRSTIKRLKKGQPTPEAVPPIPSSESTEAISYKNFTKEFVVSDAKIEGVAESSDSAFNFVRAIAVSSMFHPKHESFTAQLYMNNSSSSTDGFLIKLACAQTILTQTCKELDLTINVVQGLIGQYFESSVGFSLFHKPTFSDKIRDISDYRYLVALLAAMFSISTRFHDDSADGDSDDSVDGQKNHEKFHRISMKFIDEMLVVCSEEPPPFCLLQAMTLAVFYKLITGVRGTSWRLLGVSVRVAYELRLHLVDYEGLNEPPSDESSIRVWILNEEKRRCWWALWEIDAFASIILRLPTAIHGQFNDTYLPVLDTFWFTSHHQRSCLLENEPSQRWKTLVECKNESPTAWRILFISLICGAQVLSRGNMQSLLSDLDQDDQVSHLLHYFKKAYKTKCSSEDWIKFSNLIAAFRDACNSMPEALRVFDDLTNLRKTAAESSRHLASEKFSLFLTIEHARFMIYHIYVVQDAIDGTVRLLLPSEQLFGLSSASTTVEVYGRGLDTCLHAGDNIYDILTVCNEEYLQYVNPLFSSIIWLAASMQIFRRVFKRDAAPAVTEHKYIFLRDAYDSYVKYWGTPLTLLFDLDTLEERLGQDTSVISPVERWSPFFCSSPDQAASCDVSALMSCTARDRDDFPDSKFKGTYSTSLNYTHQLTNQALIPSSSETEILPRYPGGEEVSLGLKSHFED
ncbi:fungal-specific transcription factor domain-containing protein [Kockiozyma suomiensis]|uniref:fungal-specific transcription factor domain-containing protein n=1 Tax=Kockiozyma suomiensis TaxID=1337062 RepID=UPI003343AB79